MALPAQNLASLTQARAAVKVMQRSAAGVSDRFWLLLIGGLLVAAVVLGRRLSEREPKDPFLEAMDSAPVDDEIPTAEEEQAAKAAETEAVEDWSEVSRRLVV